MNYHTLYTIKTKDGHEYRARLIKLNKYCGKQELWRREDDVPKKERYIKVSDVIEITPFRSMDSLCGTSI